MTLNILRILGQIVIWFFIILTGGILVDMSIPGNGAVCDAGQIFLVWLWGIFLISSLLLLFNSIYHYYENKWIRYRVISIWVILVFVVLSIGLRSTIFTFYFGSELAIIENAKDSGLYIDLKLYNNGKFFVETYDLSCEEEIKGNYRLTQDLLELEYESDSKYLGYKYRVEGNEFYSLDSDLILRRKN